MNNGKKDFQHRHHRRRRTFQPCPCTRPRRGSEAAQTGESGDTRNRTGDTRPGPDFLMESPTDGEKRDHRLQIVCKTSVAQKAAEIARARGVSVAYLFEQLILEQWERDHGQN